MARDPGSTWAPLPEAGPPDGRIKNKFIVHSTGDNGTAAATRRFFAGVTPNESTFIVGWGPDDPTLQIMDSTDHADANGDANDEGISVEVVGDGKGGYNPWQRSELIRLGLWARRAHPLILPQVIASAAQASAGFGWHIMFGAPGPWAKAAKICPGPIRIAELKADIFPAIFAGKSDPIPSLGGTDMDLIAVPNGTVYKLTDFSIEAEPGVYRMGAIAKARGLQVRKVTHEEFLDNQADILNRRAALLTELAKAAGGDIDEAVIVAGLLPKLVEAISGRTGATREEVEKIVRGVFGDAAEA